MVWSKIPTIRRRGGSLLLTSHYDCKQDTHFLSRNIYGCLNDSTVKQTVVIPGLMGLLSLSQCCSVLTGAKVPLGAVLGCCIITMTLSLTLLVTMVEQVAQAPTHPPASIGAR